MKESMKVNEIVISMWQKCDIKEGHELFNMYRLFLSAFTKFEKRILLLLCLSVCPSAWYNSVPTAGYSCKFKFEYFSKICQDNSSFFNI
jgi:hypothetical protein